MHIKGRIHYVDNHVMWASLGNKIYRSSDQGGSWQVISKISFRSILSLFSSKWHITSRLLRSSIHHIVPLTNRYAVVMAGKEIFQVDIDNKKTENASYIKGSRPLAICEKNGLIYYGEYISNPIRREIAIFKNENFGLTWEIVWKFTGIRHIHGIYHDPYTDCIWITTGDDDHESGIWRTTDNFVSLEHVIGGSQQVRVVDLIFTPEFVYFGSDAPDEPNYLYRYHRNEGRVEQLQKVGSSVFYGTVLYSKEDYFKEKPHIFFATVCEPSEVNRQDKVELWHSYGGNEWHCLTTFKKDFLPFKYFQYGQILFPKGEGDGNNLWFSTFATEHDHKTFKIPLKSLEN